MPFSKSAMKRTDRMRNLWKRKDIASFEIANGWGKVCGKMFRTVNAYNQHRLSSYLRGTAGFALPDETKANVTAAAHPNISTAAVERQPAKRTRGIAKMTYHAYFCIFSNSQKQSQNGPTPEG